MADYIFKGLSSFNFTIKNKSITLTDVDLIKRDILNGLFTTRGSVPKNRKLGTQLPSLLFKQMTDETLNSVYNEITTVISNEPRVRSQFVDVKPNYEQKSVTVTIGFFIVTFPSTPQQIDLFLEFKG